MFIYITQNKNMCIISSIYNIVICNPYNIRTYFNFIINLLTLAHTQQINQKSYNEIVYVFEIMFHHFNIRDKNLYTFFI